MGTTPPTKEHHLKLKSNRSHSETQSDVKRGESAQFHFQSSFRCVPLRSHASLSVWVGSGNPREPLASRESGIASSHRGTARFPRTVTAGGECARNMYGQPTCPPGAPKKNFHPGRAQEAALPHYESRGKTGTPNLYKNNSNPNKVFGLAPRLFYVSEVAEPGARQHQVPRDAIYARSI